MRAPARKPCLDCGRIGIWRAGNRCDTCAPARARKRDRAPGRRAIKAKYDAQHRRDRRAWLPLVIAGVVTCWRCDRRILPGDRWHLGHRPGQPSHPEHAACNLQHSNEGKHQ